MSNILKSAILGVGLIVGIAGAASAQTVSSTMPGTSIANLPPEGPRASSRNSIQSPATQAVVPSPGYLGPKPGDGWYGKETQTQAVAKSPEYIGPRPN